MGEGLQRVPERAARHLVVQGGLRRSHAVVQVVVGNIGNRLHQQLVAACHHRLIAYASGTATIWQAYSLQKYGLMALMLFLPVVLMIVGMGFPGFRQW